jgi:predicted nucleic acid-binding protein
LKVIVDTRICSLVLRRSISPGDSISTELENLIKDIRVKLFDSIRQDILSGIKSDRQFEKLKTYLRSFPYYNIQSENYEQATRNFNQCRSKGIQGSNTDFLICSAAVNNNW